MIKRSIFLTGDFLNEAGKVFFALLYSKTFPGSQYQFPQNDSINYTLLGEWIIERCATKIVVALEANAEFWDKMLAPIWYRHSYKSEIPSPAQTKKQKTVSESEEAEQKTKEAQQKAVLVALQKNMVVLANHMIKDDGAFAHNILSNIIDNLHKTLEYEQHYSQRAADNPGKNLEVLESLASYINETFAKKLEETEPTYIKKDKSPLDIFEEHIEHNTLDKIPAFKANIVTQPDFAKECKLVLEKLKKDKDFIKNYCIFLLLLDNLIAYRFLEIDGSLIGNSLNFLSHLIFEQAFTQAETLTAELQKTICNLMNAFFKVLDNLYEEHIRKNNTKPEALMAIIFNCFLIYGSSQNSAIDSTTQSNNINNLQNNLAQISPIATQLTATISPVLDKLTLFALSIVQFRAEIFDEELLTKFNALLGKKNSLEETKKYAETCEISIQKIVQNPPQLNEDFKKKYLHASEKAAEFLVKYNKLSKRLTQEHSAQSNPVTKEDMRSFEENTYDSFKEKAGEFKGLIRNTLNTSENTTEKETLNFLLHVLASLERKIDFDKAKLEEGYLKLQPQPVQTISPATKGPGL